MEDLRAQIEAIADGQTSFDLWVPDEVTLNGAPLRQDAAMALLVDRLLARGLFPHGFSAGAGGRTYHYRQGPPEVPGGVPPAGKPLRVPRVLEAGKAYQLHVEHRGLALYEAVWRIPATKGGPRTFVTHEVSLIVRTADGFIGECEVKDSTLGPDFPTTTTKITSTRD